MNQTKQDLQDRRERIARLRERCYIEHNDMISEPIFREVIAALEHRLSVIDAEMLKTRKI